MATTDNNLKIIDDNPWKGLNFYVEGETLYGRDKEIKTLSEYIINNSQTVLYGKSGIGKSSIINAGIFPITRSEGLFPVALRFSHDNSDRATYLTQIKNAFHESGIVMEELYPVLDYTRESLWEFFHRHSFYHPDSHEAVRPLVVFDQFEEIFTLQRDEKTKKGFFSELADLINEVTPQYIIDAQHSDKQNHKEDSDKEWSTDDELDFGIDDNQRDYIEGSNFNMVFVLREDFLSYFERYTAYIPAMKTNRFSLLPINEEQAAEIIMKPREGLVSKEVAKLIIQKVTDNADFKLDGIPEIEVSATMLSLYLSRLYLKKGSEKNITAEMVNQFGDYIIKDFYEESVADIPKDEIEKLEDELITNGMRDNSFIVYLTDKEKNPNAISKETIDTLVKRKLLRQYPDPLQNPKKGEEEKVQKVEFMHDTLCKTVNERKEHRKMAKIQEAVRKRQEEEQKRREDKIREEEELKRKEIEQKALLERLRHEQETKQIKERNRRRIKRSIVAAALIMTILAGFLIRYWLYEKPYTCTYANFTTLNGWPVGINEIDPGRIESEIKGTTFGRIIVYYRLTRKGSLNRNPFYKVEVISAYDHKPTTNKFIESPAVGLWCSEFGNDGKAKDFAELQKKTAYWIYTASEQGAETAGRCTAFGLDDKELYSIQFNRDNTTSSADKKKYVQWAVYYDASGMQMIINNNGIDRMRQTVDNGRVTSCLFFSMLGVPQKNEREAYGYQYNINDTTHLLRTVHRVGKFGNKITNDSITYIDYEFGRSKKTTLYEVTYPKPGMIVRKYKDYSDTLEFYGNGDVKHGSFHPDFQRQDFVVSFSYDQNGLITFKQIRSEGQMVMSENYTYTNVADTILPKEIKRTVNGISFSERYSYPDDTTKVMEFWQNGNRIMLKSKTERGDALCYHKCITTSSDSTDLYSIETKVYQDTLGRLVEPIDSNDRITFNFYSKVDIIKKKNTDIILTEYYYNKDNNIIKSIWNQYDDYGNQVATGVAGIDGKPVRCPNWSWYDLCCYKMSLLVPLYSKNNNSTADKGTFASMNVVSMHGVNEFNDSSLVMLENDNVLYNWVINETKMESMKLDNPDNTLQMGISTAVSSLKRSDMRYTAYFIHVLSKNSTSYSAGLRDGDIIIKINGSPANDSAVERLKTNGNSQLVIARANPKYKNYSIIPITVPEGDPRIHVHHLALTKEEYNRLKHNN